MKNWNRAQWIHCGMTMLSFIAGLASICVCGFLRAAQGVHNRWHIQTMEKSGDDSKYSLLAGYQNTTTHLYDWFQISMLVAAVLFLTITIWMVFLFKKLRSKMP